MTEYKVSCHCKAVQGVVIVRKSEVILWDCNCSDCNMRKNLHFVVPACDFRLTKGEENQTTYLWGTKTAQRRFCSICGILPYYIPKSNPDGVGITSHCVDWTSAPDGQKPKFIVKTYDGQNWDKSHAASGIAAESKPVSS